MTVMNLRRKGFPRMQLSPMSKLATLNVSVSRRLLSPDPHDTSKSVHSMKVDDCPGMKAAHRPGRGGAGPRLGLELVWPGNLLEL
jgi:hypothetical protein